ncbi:MAG: hypothetical protein ACHQIM_03790 [Sphingobacteriales bacterium]
MMRLSQKIKKGLLLIMVLGLIRSVSAQNTFKYAAPVHTVNTSGFYRIALHPDLVAKSNADLSDIRLIDQKSHFVPYLNANNLPQSPKEKFIVFPEVLVKSKADTSTAFVVESKVKAPVNMLWVKLKNTSVKRLVNLSGSDDLKQWFAIKEDIPLREGEINSDGTYLQSLSFPASDYHYLKLLVNDKNKAPVKFLEAGIYTEQSLANLYFPIRPGKIVRKDSNNVTFITMQLNDQYLINKVTLSVSAPKYYKRDVSIYKIDKQGYQSVGDTELNSNKDNSLFIAAKTDKLELQISNGDNLPLSIDSVKVAQAGQYIVSYLESGQSYWLLTGDVKASAPDYDLKFFTDSIHATIPEIGNDPLTKNAAYAIRPTQVKREYPGIIWAAIIVVLALLSLLTWKMIGEVNNKKVNK